MLGSLYLRLSILILTVLFWVPTAYSDSSKQGPRESEVDYLSRQQVIEIFLEQYLPTNENAETLAAFLFDNTGVDSLLHPEMLLSSSDSSFSLVIENPSYFFWVDNEPESEWMHPTEFIVMDALEGTYSVYESEGWPALNGEEYLEFTEGGNESPNLIFGGFPILASLYQFTPVARTNDKDWAIMVVSRNLHGAREKVARKNDINRIKEILNGADLGPKLKNENITVVPGLADTMGATSTELCAAIDALKGKKCRKLYFFYLGHGARTGRMVLRDGEFSYEDLADKLASVDAGEYCVVIEACYSGSSFKALSARRTYKDGKKRKRKSLTGVAVSSSSKRETTTRQGDGTPFYKGLNACYKDSNADLNEDGKITILEAVAWAAAINPKVAEDGPQGKLLKKYTNKEPRIDFLPNSYTYNYGGLEFELACACYKVKKRGYDKVCRKVLYVENKTTREKDMSDLEVVCLKGKSGKRQKGDPHLFEHSLPPRLRGVGHRICLGELPQDCFRFLVRERGSKAPALATTIAPEAQVYVQSLECQPGDTIFDAYILETDLEHNYSAVIQGPENWDLSIDPEAFKIPMIQDSAMVFIKGIFPVGALRGDRFRTILTNLTDPDTSQVEFNVLMYDSLQVMIEGGTHIENMSYDVFQGGIQVLSDSATIKNSVLNFKDEMEIFVGANGHLNFVHAAIMPDSSGDFSFSISGGLRWDHAQVSLPLQGITLDSPHGSMIGGGIYGSEDDAIKFYGDYSNMELGYFTVEQSAINGLFFETATACTLNAVRVLDSVEDDVTLFFDSRVCLVDCSYDSTKESVDETSVLTRAWSTTFLVQDRNGVSISNVDLEVRNLKAELVAAAVTDSGGFSSILKLPQYIHDGSGVQNVSPHQVTLRYEGMDTTFAYTPLEQQVVAVNWESVTLVPVRLVSLGIERQETGALLTWKVESASDHAGFRVYRETTGGVRTEITATLLSGQSTYRFLDEDAPAGETRYWLAEIARTGDVSWHGPILLDALGLPHRLRVRPGYPNPFSSSLTLVFELPQHNRVRVEVFSIEGRRVATLADEDLKAGPHQIAWTGRNADGSRAGAGIYFIRIRAGKESLSQKVVLTASP